MERPASYQTKQREAILSHIASLQDSHFTAAQIAEHFAKSQNPVGLTTIYRHLEKLVESGIVRKYSMDGVSGACFQYMGTSEDCGEHFHLKCDNCGELLHFSCALMGEMHRHISDDHDFKVNAMKTVFYGTCGRCRGIPETEANCPAPEGGR